MDPIGSHSIMILKLGKGNWSQVPAFFLIMKLAKISYKQV